MEGIREHYNSLTRRVKAGNSKRPCCVNADIAKVGREFIVDVEISYQPNKTWLKETRISSNVKRRRRYE